MKNTYKTHSPEETIELGEKLGRKLKGGETICLTGDLGGGKTHFAKGIAKGAGIEETITSPTFVLMRDYEVEEAPNLYHLDLYRIGSYEDIEPLDLEDLIGNPNAVVVIEWPENVPEIIPENAIWVRFKYLEEEKREVEIEQK